MSLTTKDNMYYWYQQYLFYNTKLLIHCLWDNIISTIALLQSNNKFNVTIKIKWLEFLNDIVLNLISINPSTVVNDRYQGFWLFRTIGIFFFLSHFDTYIFHRRQEYLNKLKFIISILYLI